MPLDLFTALRRAPDPRAPRAPSLLRTWDGDEPLAGRTVLLGLPYDGGIPSRPGARFGPRALREALAHFGTCTGRVDLADAPPVLDLGDVDLPTMNGAEAHAHMEAAARAVWASGARPIFVGGDHGCTGSVLRGLAAARPHTQLAVANIDAHLDVREYADDAHLSSGTPFRRALETGIVTGGRMATVGVRRFANSRYDLDWARAAGLHLVSVEEVAEHGAAAVAAAVLHRITAGADTLYLSIDLDAVDAAFAPGVSAAGVGGLDVREALALVQTLAAHPALIGADLMELSPPHDADARTAKLGARLLLELLAARGGY